MQIITEITINASPEKVWKVFTDFDKYEEWNPFIKSLTGKVRIGEKIKVALPGMNFQPTVKTLQVQKEFSWLGHLFFKGIFDGNHKFQFIDNKNGSTQFIHSESFSGILVGLFKKKLLSETKTGFEEMNHQLKMRVESIRG